MPKKIGWSKSVLDAVVARKEAHRAHASIADDKSDTKAVRVRHIAPNAAKDSLTLQKENNCLSMLLAGHFGTETGDNTADVVWGRDEFEVIVNRKKQ